MEKFKKELRGLSLMLKLYMAVHVIWLPIGLFTQDIKGILIACTFLICATMSLCTYVIGIKDMPDETDKNEK